MDSTISAPIRIFSSDPSKGTMRASDSPASIQKQYEDMTFDEMTHCLAETYKELAGILNPQAVTPTTSSSTSSSSSTLSLSSCEKSSSSSFDDGVDEWAHVDDTTKRSKLTRLFWRSASAGHTDKVRSLLENDDLKRWIDLDGKDEDGTTPLIYAVCFGKFDIAHLLLSSGAKTDIQDSFGWTALMWATNNNHDHIVKLLLEHGASAQTKSSKGRTVFDFVNTENQKIVDILSANPHDSLSSLSSLSSRPLSNDDYDFYYRSPVDDDHFATTMTDDSNDDGNHGNDQDDNDDDNDDDDDDNMAMDISDHNDFQWNKCLPDQMFVFAVDDLPYILDTMITDIQLPLQSHHDICIPANVIFLSARFAYYFSTEELLNQVLDGSLQRITNTIKAHTNNIHVLAFWMTNLTQLLHYLKKDTGLIVTTVDHQLNLSELISETYTALVSDTEHRIAKLFVPAMLEHNEIPGMDEVNFTDDWQRFFFRKGSRRSMVCPPAEGSLQTKRHSVHTTAATSIEALSPHAITSLLSSTLFVLRSYNVHPSIITQALAQFFHYLSSELFNRILTTKKLLCRSKAMQIRMNLSVIEDWISDNHLPGHLVSYLTPTMQLLQLLQCLTQLTDFVSFINTVKTFDVLNALQIKRCVINYRYEVNEPRLPDEVVKYAMQLVQDTVRLQQQSSIALSRQSSSSSSSLKSSRRESRMGVFMSSIGIITADHSPSNIDELPSSPIDMYDDDDDHDNTIQETKDATHMLPFSVPTSTHQRFLVPIIPEDWMNLLDKDPTDSLDN